jgi:transposase
MGAVDDDRLKRHDLTDAEWAWLEPLLPRHPRQGHRWNDHRLVMDGIFFRTRGGLPVAGPAGADRKMADRV